MLVGGSNMRGRLGAVIAAIGVAVLAAGCTTQETGTPEQAPYRPLPIDSLSASMATPIEDAIAYSSNGALAATRSRSGVCIEHVDDPDHQVCADLGTSVGQVLFSPDGSTLAALESYQQTFRGRLWLISTKDGGTRRVAWPDFSASSPTGPTKPRPTPTRTPGSGGDEDGGDLAYVAIDWTERGRLLALAAGVATMAATDTVPAGADSDHLVRVDPGSGRPTDLGEIASGDRRAAGTLIAGGGVALLTQLPDRDRAPQLIAVDLGTRKTRTVTLTGDVVTDDSRVLPLAVAPDGASALLWVVDPAKFVRSPPARVDLDTGEVTVIDGTGDLLPIAGAYSPDGSQLALIAWVAEQDRSVLAVLPAGGGTARTLTDIDDDPTTGTGLRWTRTDMLVPRLTAGVVSLHGLAPVQLAG